MVGKLIEAYARKVEFPLNDGMQIAQERIEYLPLLLIIWTTMWNAIQKIGYLRWFKVTVCQDEKRSHLIGIAVKMFERFSNFNSNLSYSQITGYVGEHGNSNFKSFLHIANLFCRLILISYFANIPRFNIVME